MSVVAVIGVGVFFLCVDVAARPVGAAAPGVRVAVNDVAAFRVVFCRNVDVSATVVGVPERGFVVASIDDCVAARSAVLHFLLLVLLVLVLLP